MLPSRNLQKIFFLLRGTNDIRQTTYAKRVIYPVRVIKHHT
jgi:hypothetical protein